MGWLDRFRRGRSYVVRENFQTLPQDQWTDDEYDHWFRNIPEAEAWAEWEAWSRQTIPHPAGIKFLRRGCLDMAREAARETDSDAPREFACLLRVEGETVEELVLIPGTVSGDEHAIFDMWMAPLDKAVKGSLHSHPDEHPYPSDADLELFEKHGEIHLILCRPYGPGDWRAYDFLGRPVALDVVD